MTSAKDGVVFDIGGDGRPVQIAWTSQGSNNAFLALDRNRDGKINSGKELFGNFTAQPQSNDPNGFLALAEFDKPENGGNGDGIIDSRDKVFAQMVLWIDENHDGISQPNELHSLPELGVFSLALKYRESRRTDEFGNQFRYRATVNPDPKDGESKDGRIAYDVFFVEARVRGRKGSAAERATRGYVFSGGGSYQNGILYDGLAFGRPRATRSEGLREVSHDTNSDSRGEVMKTPMLLLAGGLCGVAPALCAQQVATSLTVNLRPTSKVELPLSRSMQMIEGIKCDAAGNIYGRPLNVTRYTPADMAQIPVQEFAPDGKLTAAFKVTGPSEHIFVGHGGDVYQIFHETYVAQFAKDGSVKSKTKLQTGPDVRLRHVAVFKSGRYLASGEADKMGNSPYAAVFEPDGRLVKKVSEPEDEDARRKAELGDSEFTGATVGGYNLGNNFVSRGDVTLGDDGNVYLMHGGSPTLVYGISPAGDVVRKFRVASSEPGRAAWSVKSYAGRLAFAFPADDHIEIQVTDFEGSSIAGYIMRPLVKPNDVDTLDLACYDSNGLTLITVEASSNLYLLRAKP